MMLPLKAKLLRHKNTLVVIAQRLQQKYVKEEIEYVNERSLEMLKALSEQVVEVSVELALIGEVPKSSIQGFKPRVEIMRLSQKHFVCK